MAARRWTPVYSVTDTALYDGFGMTVSRTGSTATPFGFVGAGQYQSDGDSGLMLLGHRMYDTSVGRFISSDPAKAGANWYAYCGDNPLSRTDPSGLISLKDAWYWLTHGFQCHRRPYRKSPWSRLSRNRIRRPSPGGLSIQRDQAK